jgi:uncharacterized membrane protein YwzB
VVYRAINMTVYVISVVLAMIGLSSFNFEQHVRKGKIKEFYIFYFVASIALAYLFASFILNFTMWSFN